MCLGRLVGADWRTGITVNGMQDKVFVLFARLGFTIGDEAALKTSWRLKGASSFRPCALCQNVVNGRLLDAIGSQVDLRCADMSLLQLHTDESFRECWNRLAAARPQDRGPMEKRLGMKYHCASLVNSPILRDVIR